MKSIFRTTLILLTSVVLAPVSEATLIQAGWFFDGNDNVAVGTLSQTVTAAGGNVTFDFDVTITSSSGNDVIDTSSGDGISSTAGANLAVGEDITFAVSISNVVQNGPHRILLDNLSFRFLGTENANGSASAGTLTTPAGSSGTSWIDANGPGSDFGGHLPGVTLFGGLDVDGFRVNTSTGNQTPGNFNVQAGFDIPRSNITNGGLFGTPVTLFSHTVDAGTFTRLNDLVVQIRATPEPSSIALGLVALGFGGVVWRRRKNAAEAETVV